MKKILAIIVILCCLLSLVGVLSACEEDNWDNGNLKVVTTIFPEYDWTLNLLGEHEDEVNVRNLLNSGVDMHSYQATFRDKMYISTCDLLVYVGGESDDWVETSLKQATNKDMVVIKLLDVIENALDEADGIEGEEHDHDHEEGAFDEHVWMSLRRAKIAVNAIAEALETLMPDSAETLAQNAASYCEQLDALDVEYRQVVDSTPTKTLVVADRFPFAYLFDDYGLSYYAAFKGCSAANDPSWDTILTLVEKVDNLNAKVIIITESSDGKTAQQVKNKSQTKNQKILKLNSMQSVGANDGANGVTYLTIMQSNLDVLREALQ